MGGQEDSGSPHARPTLACPPSPAGAHPLFQPCVPACSLSSAWLPCGTCATNGWWRCVDRGGVEGALSEACSLLPELLKGKLTLTPLLQRSMSQESWAELVQVSSEAPAHDDPP